LESVKAADSGVEEWPASKSITEKGFSVGLFDRAYLKPGACAVVRRGSSIVAFANLWTSAELEECSVDLMRHSRDAPKGVMDFLLAELMLWARSEGCRGSCSTYRASSRAA
jgi:phosphatidylglycerol lysyltransferase